MFQRLICALVGGLLLCLSWPLLGQRLVSTEAMPQRIVLEEFGGMYCVYCPQGHQIVAALHDALADDFLSLNYHVGAYASPLDGDPDLRTVYGDTIITHTGLTGYPVGTINREVHEGLEQGQPGTTAINRSNWVAAVEQSLARTALVNIAMEASLNLTTRELEVYLEYYYTGNGPGNANFLHLAIMENNVLAPQHGGSSGNFYAHQHLVRDFLTGIEGHRISTNGMGTFGSLTFRTTIPTTYRGVWVDLANIELAAFITADEQRILQGVGLQPSLIANAGADANLVALKGADDICGGNYYAQVLLRNDGLTPLTELTIEYGLSNELNEVLYWTGELEMLETTLVQLPDIVQENWSRQHQVYATLSNPNASTDPTTFNNTRTHNFTVAPNVQHNHVELVIKTDEYGYETYWEVVDAYGEVHASGGNQVVGETNGGAQIAAADDPEAYPNSALIIEDIYLPTDGCYQLRVLDDFADGLCCHYGNGFYRLRVPGQPPLLQGSDFGALAAQFFSVGGSIVNTEELVVPSTQLTLSPNPLYPGQPLQLRPSEWATTPWIWTLHNTTGQIIAKGQAPDLPSTSLLVPGYYFLKLQTSSQQQTLPFAVQ